MKTNKINEKRYEKGVSGALIVSSLNNGRTMDGHRTDNGRTSDGHVTEKSMGALWEPYGSLVGTQWETKGTSMGDKCGQEKFARFAKFAEFARIYFARVAAMLLMLVTMSVGQVWGETVTVTSPTNATTTDKDITITGTLKTTKFNNQSSVNVFKIGSTSGEANTVTVSSTSANISQINLSVCAATSGTGNTPGIDIYTSSNGSTYSAITSGISISGVAASPATMNTGVGVPVKAYGSKSDLVITFTTPVQYVRFCKQATGSNIKETSVNSISVITSAGGPTPTSHTITFDKDGKGTTTTTQTDVPDNTATALKTISTIGWAMTGNTFAGWAETVGGEVVYTDGANITITADKTLYAKWTKNNYTVTLDDQEATTAGDASVTVTYGSKNNIATGSKAPYTPKDITMPSKTGYTFGGYYTAVDGGGVLLIDEDGHFIAGVTDYTDANYNWKKASDVTLYAKWTEDAPATTYTITYSKGANGTGTIANGQKTAGVDFTLSSSTFTRDGYTQTGWALTDGGEKAYDLGGTYTTDADLTLYPFWTKDVCVPNTFTLKHGSDVMGTFVATGNANEYSVVVEFTNDNMNNQYIVDNCGNRYGNGQLNADNCLVLTEGETATYNTGGASQDKHWKFTFNSETKSLCLDAKAEEDKTYNITYELDGGTNAVGNPATYKITTATIVLADPTKSGYTFNGWYSDSEFTNAVTSIVTGSTGDITLYAKWTEDTYTVTVNSSVGGHDCSKNLSAKADQTVTITNTCEVPGYTLTGYTSTPEVSGTFNAGTYTFTMPASNVTLTAVWESGCAAPIITSQSEDQVGIKVGQNNVTISVATSTDDVTYQWYRCNSEGEVLQTLSGATAANYTIAAADQHIGVYYYKCALTHTCAEGSNDVTSELIALQFVPANFLIDYTLKASKSSGSETDLKSAATASVSQISSLSGVTLHGGLTATNNSAKTGLTAKIGNLGAAKVEDDYVTLNFHVANDYYLTISAVNITVQPVTCDDQVYYAELEDETGTKVTGTVSNITNGSTGNLVFTLDAEKQFKGVVTLKLWAWDPDQKGKTYRLSTALSIEGLLHNEPLPDVVRTITFHDGTNTDTQDVPDNVATALKAMNTIGWSHTGQTFDGWAETEGGTKVYDDREDITITADKDLYAKWTKNQYTVTLDNQEATTAGTASVTVTYGSKTNLVSAITVPTKTNNEFGGYYTAKNGAGVQVIAANGTFNKDNDYLKDDGNWKYLGNVTLYAKWTSTVTTYAITYAANGGTGTMTAAREYEAGAEVTIKTNAFTAPANKEFNGWVVTNNSTSATITVTAGKFTMPAAAVTITAQWKDKEVGGDCHTMVIFDGVSAAVAPANNATGTESTSGATWTNVSTGTTLGDANKSYSGTTYAKYWQFASSSSNNSARHIRIVIPENYTGTITMMGYHSSTSRSAFVSKSATSSTSDNLGIITTTTSNTIYGTTTAELEAGTYYVCATNGMYLVYLAVEVCPVAAGCKAPSISEVSASPKAVCSGAEVTLSASATANNAGALTYTWYNSDNIEMGTGANVTVNPEENTTYYCVVAEEGCDKTAKSSTVSVSINAATAITTQPTAATEASVGETVSLKVVATGSHLSYQWQESGDNSAWADVPVLNATAKQATLSVKVTTTGTMYYRCVVTGDCGDDTSAAASITAGAATPTVTWSDVTTVYQGQKVSISVTTNTDAAFDESALTIATENCTVGSKTVVGKTVVAELHINADAAADAEITLTFNTAAGASYGATVNNTHTLTVSGDCPTGGASGTIYTATISGQSTIGATGGEAEVSYKMSSSTKPINGNNYYKFDSSSKLKFTPTGGFLVGDVLTFNLCSSGANTDGVKISNAAGTQLADLTTALSATENRTITYTFTAATDYVTVMRHGSACYFYSATVDRVGSLTNLEWSDTDDMIEDGVVTVSSEAENFTIAAVSNNSFGAISYSLANTSLNVASINSTTAEITLQGTNLGTATVTATIAANGCYGEKNITYTLKVADNCVAPVISAHPASATYEVNSSASALSVTATGSELTYQWYRNSENNNTSGTAIGGATSASYTPDVTVRGTTYYYCEVKSGKCGTLSNVAKIEVTRPACSLPAPKIIEVSRVGGDCWTSITLKAVEQNGDALVGGTYQWYLDGEAFSTAAQPTITVAGTYTLEYTKDECTVDASNEFKAPSTAPEVGLLSPFQYYHAGKSDYSDQMNDRHLFLYESLSDADPTYTATLNDVAMAGDQLATLQGALERKEGKNNVDTIMLSLNDLVGCGFTAGDEVVITVTPKNCSGAEVAGEAKSIALHVVDSRPTLAFIVSGADGDGTKTKKSLKLNGDFLTGYNKADLKVQTALTTVSDAELPLYTALKENYNVVPVNGYAPFSKWNYEPFDLTFLTDFVKTDGGNGDENKAIAKEKVNQLAGIVDFRPMFSTKSFMSGISNWTKLGFTANPVAPKKTQKWMNIVCYAHPMFEQFLEQDDIVKEDQGEGNYEVVFTMLSRGGFDKSKGIQGFKLSDVSAFVNIATTHYNASANIDYENHTCTPDVAGADDELLIASCERQKNIEARMIMLSVNADATSFLTEEGINVIVLSLNYLLETDPIKVTDCSVTFLGTEDDDWNKPANWNSNKVPVEKNNVRIAAPCVVKNGERAVAASVKILNNCTYAGSAEVKNGSLVIEPTGALSITGIISRVEDNKYLDLLPTHVEDVTIQSSVSGNGALIHGDEGDMIKATVEMYSKAHYEPAGEGKTVKYWQYVGIPVAQADFNTDFYGAYTYEYSEASGWLRVRNGYGQLFVGYGLSQQAAKLYPLAGTLASTADRVIALTKTDDGAEGENLIGNSWTAPINIASFDAADFKNAEATVYVYNTGRDNREGTQESDWVGGADNTTAGQWVTVAVSAAKGGEYVGLKVIPAMQAFEVKATGAGAKLTLDYDRLVRGTAAADINTPLRAPGRGMAAKSNEVDPEDVNMMRVRVADEKTHTDLYLMEHPMFSDAFDNGWDAGFLEGDGRSAMLSAASELGDMAFLAKESIDGTILNFAAGRESQYTFSFGYSGEVTYYLNDLQLQTSTLITRENTYIFTTSDGDLEHRFIISATPLSKVTTDIGGGSGGKMDRVQKIFLNGKLYIIKGGRIYDATGRLAY